MEVAIQCNNGAYQHWRYHNDPDYRQRANARSVAYIKHRKEVDPEFREYMKQHSREFARKYYQKPDIQAKRAAYTQDPEYRAKKAEYDRARRQRLKEERAAMVIIDA